MSEREMERETERDGAYYTSGNRCVVAISHMVDKCEAGRELCFELHKHNVLHGERRREEEKAGTREKK